MPTSRPSRGHAALRRRRVLASAGLTLSVVLNLWAVAQAGDQADSSGSTPPSAAKSVRVAPSVSSSLPVAQKGDGSFTVLPVLSLPTNPVAAATPIPSTPSTPSTPTSRPAASPLATARAGRVVRYTVEVEGGLGADTRELASVVSTVLADPRGWQSADGVRFVNVPPAEAAQGAAVDVRISLASPDTTDRLCAPLETRGEVSCHNGGRAVLNLRRWLLGVEAYGSDLAAYRTYLVNHEVGHALGHGHVVCPGAGKDAPVMMQQTYGLDGCIAWSWPTLRT